jgi:hypothetical protein
MPDASFIDRLLDLATPEGFTVGTLVALFFIGLYRGWLATGREVRDIRTDRDARLADQDSQTTQLLADKDKQIEQWREAYLNTVAALDEARVQAGELLELARSGEQLLRALPRASTAARNRDDKPTR